MLFFSAGVPEEAGAQAGFGFLPLETSPTAHQVPAATQGSVNSSDGESCVDVTRKDVAKLVLCMMIEQSHHNEANHFLFVRALKFS